MKLSEFLIFGMYGSDNLYIYSVTWQIIATVSMAVGTGGAFPQKKQKKKKRFETQLSNKYNMPYLIMIHCKCDFAFLTQQE